MDNIFGLSMTTILIVTLAIMGLCLLTTAIIALRNRVIFRMAVRNIPRRKAQTILIMVGLMLSTLIIAASLTTGDTLDYSIKRSTYQGLGQTDETIAFVGADGAESDISINNIPISTDIVHDLEARFEDDPDIEGFMPLLTVSAPVVNLNARLSEPFAIVTGVDPSRLDRFDALRTPEGETIPPSTIAPGMGVISEDLAEEVGASVGDHLIFVYDNQPRTVEVAAIAKGSILTGLSTTGESVNLLGIAVPLNWLQELTGLPGQARFIAVSNRGGVEDGAVLSESVVPKLEQALAEIDGGEQLGVNPIKQDALKGAESFGNIIMSFFIVLGLFSVAAGILLIFLIFMMLAAERRSEMGMARAVGMRRRHLIQGFIAEGAAYDLGAALIGAAAGVGVAFVMAGFMARLIGEFIAITPHASWRSLVVAYALGTSVTFLTIVFASIRSSRLNIVQAIRDLPEIKGQRHDRPRRRGWRPDQVVRHGFALFRHDVGWSPVIALLGVLAMAQGAGSASLFFFSLGVSLVALGLARFLARFLPERPVYTAAAALMLGYWLAPDSLLAPLLPELEGDFEMFFLSGIMMVTFSTLLIMWNADLIVGAVAILGRVVSRWLPAVKTAVAYPLASKGRTGMTIAMFSLVIFSLVMMTTINRNFAALFSTDEADAGWDVMIATNPSNPIDDLLGALRDSPEGDVDPDQIAAVGRLSSMDWSSAGARVAGEGDAEWQDYIVSGMDVAYIENAEIPLRARAVGYASDEDVWQAIQSDPTLAVIDDWALGADAFSGRDAFEPRLVDVINRRSGETGTVTVIGVVDAKVSTVSGLLMNEEEFSRIYPQPDLESVLVKLRSSDSALADEMAKELEAALFERGVQAISINDRIEQMVSIQSGFLKLLQGFMGLGLLVGIAALGVISFRAVVERRQQIGMLRALGYQRRMVALSFVLESLVVAVLGIVSGAALALILSYNLLHSDNLTESQPFDGFIVPWATIAFFVGASLAAAALMTWIPARKASSAPIAEALRYE